MELYASCPAVSQTSSRQTLSSFSFVSILIVSGPIVGPLIKKFPLEALCSKQDLPTAKSPTTMVLKIKSGGYSTACIISSVRLFSMAGIYD